MTEKQPTDQLVPPEAWCDHNPEWSDNAGHCKHPLCTVAGRQVWEVSDD